jgi:hypothetical protein
MGAWLGSVKMPRAVPYVAGLSLLLLGANFGYTQDLDPEKLKSFIAEALAKRRISEARARVLDGNLDQDDVQLLSDEELESSPPILIDKERSFAREPSSQFATPNVLDSANPGFRYRFWDFGSKRPAQHELPVDSSLSAPQIEVNLSNPLFPVVRVPKITPADGRPVLYFFEFDTTPDFSSPNSWRYPSLRISNTIAFNELEQRFEIEQGPFQNLTGRAGIALDVFHPSQRGEFALSNEVRFPFRASAMRLPNRWDALTYDELERQALALGYGLSPQDMIDEIQHYVRHTFVWSNDNRPVLDTFRAGMGGCGGMNNFMGALLELNGLRSRTICGLNPKVRVIAPDSGHCAIEVFEPQTGSWSYVDAYLDIILHGISAEQLARGNDSAASIVIGENYTIGQLFKYRVYADNTIGRLRNTSMLKLQAGPGEREYGNRWKLNTAAPRPLEEFFPERQTIYVRARYVLGGSGRMQPLDAPLPAPVLGDPPVASSWAATNFEIAPRLLMRPMRIGHEGLAFSRDSFR